MRSAISLFVGFMPKDRITCLRKEEKSSSIDVDRSEERTQFHLHRYFRRHFYRIIRKHVETLEKKSRECLRECHRLKTFRFSSGEGTLRKKRMDQCERRTDQIDYHCFFGCCLMREMLPYERKMR